MKPLLALSLLGLVGCAKKATAPVPPAPPQPETTTLTNVDFKKVVDHVYSCGLIDGAIKFLEKFNCSSVDELLKGYGIEVAK